MSGEYINSDSIEDYWSELKKIYHSRADSWKDLNDFDYKAIERSERADSDNEYNLGRFGTETQVIDICHYKYLPGRSVAYHIEIMHKNGEKVDRYFQIKLKDQID
jgi:hypothetical protein